MFYAIVMYTTKAIIQQASSGAGYGDQLVHHDGGRVDGLVTRSLDLDETVVRRRVDNAVANGALETRVVLSCVAYIWTHLVCTAPMLFQRVTGVHALDHGWLMSLVVASTNAITSVWKSRGGGRAWWPENTPGSCDACMLVLCDIVIGVREPSDVVAYIVQRAKHTVKPGDLVYSSDQLIERIELVPQEWFTVQDYGDMGMMRLNPVMYTPDYKARALEDAVDTRPDPITDGAGLVGDIMRSSRRNMNGWSL